MMMMRCGLGALAMALALAGENAPAPHFA